MHIPSKNVWTCKELLFSWGLQIAPETIQRGESTNSLGYKICLQKFNHSKYKSGEINYEFLMIFKNCWEILIVYDQQSD